jgi:hypothetical protein
MSKVGGQASEQVFGFTREAECGLRLQWFYFLSWSSMHLAQIRSSFLRAQIVEWPWSCGWLKEVSESRPPTIGQ